jgi:hypothetical protein
MKSVLPVRPVKSKLPLYVASRQRAYCYVPEDTTYAVVFREMASVNY